MQKHTDSFYFIEFANDKSSTVEHLYDNWSSKSEVVVTLPQSVDIDDPPVYSYFGCIGPDLQPIPGQMPKFISSLRASVQNILDQIINNGGKLIESEDLKSITNLKERYVTTYEITDGKLIEKPGILDDDQWKIYVSPPWLKDVCYSLFEFLCSKDFPRLKKCPYCDRFFIAKDSKRLICYEIPCKNKYHKEDMKKRRETHPEKYC